VEPQETLVQLQLFQQLHPLEAVVVEKELVTVEYLEVLEEVQVVERQEHKQVEVEIHLPLVLPKVKMVEQLEAQVPMHKQVVEVELVDLVHLVPLQQVVQVELELVLDQVFGELLLECPRAVIDFLQVEVEHQIVLTLLLVNLVEQVEVVQVLVIQLDLHQLVQQMQEQQTLVAVVVEVVLEQDTLLIVVQVVQV
jgi:hypothetical protein